MSVDTAPQPTRSTSQPPPTSVPGLFRVPRAVARLFSALPLHVYPPLPLLNPRPIPIPHHATLYVFTGHPTPPSAKSAPGVGSHTWASRDPISLRWQMEAVFRGLVAPSPSPDPPQASDATAASSQRRSSTTTTTTTTIHIRQLPPEVAAGVDPRLADADEGAVYGPAGHRTHPPYLQRGGATGQNAPHRSIVGHVQLESYMRRASPRPWEAETKSQADVKGKGKESSQGDGGEGAWSPWPSAEVHAQVLGWEIVLDQIEAGLLVEILLDAAPRVAGRGGSRSPLALLDGASDIDVAMPWHRAVSRRLRHLLRLYPVPWPTSFSGASYAAPAEVRRGTTGLNLVPSWTISLSGLVGYGGGHGAGGVDEGTDDDATDAAAVAPVELPADVCARVLERARQGLVAIATQLRLGASESAATPTAAAAQQWFLGASQPTSLDAHLFALLHTILSQPYDAARARRRAPLDGTTAAAATGVNRGNGGDVSDDDDGATAAAGLLFARPVAAGGSTPGGVTADSLRDVLEENQELRRWTAEVWRRYVRPLGG